MKRPTWATVVGILGIIFGGFGILGGGYEMMMPKVMKMQQQFMGELRDEMQRQARKQDKMPEKGPPSDEPWVEPGPEPDTGFHGNNAPPEAVFEMMENMWRVPSWFERWSVPMGLARMVVSAAYLLAAIALLQVKRHGIRLFYAAAGASILLAAVKVGAGIGSESMMVMGLLMGAVFSAIIDLVLIVVVATSDKRAFDGTAAPPPLPM